MTIISKIKKALTDSKAVILKLNEFRIQNFILMNSKVIHDFFFIQIGSNDGKTSDPLHKFITKYKWRGILIEPVPHLFKKLKSTYKNYNNLTFENVEIANKEGYKDFFRIKENNEPNNPDWYDQIGSFNKNIILKHRDEIPNFDKYFIKEKIKCLTFQSLIKKNNVKKIDLLHIDAEGYDLEIIKTINFNEIKPRMILYEHLHLSNLDKNSCNELLKKEGYKLIVKYGDTFAHL